MTEFIELNENQQIVLEWLKKMTGISSMVISIAMLNDLILRTSEREHDEKVKKAYVFLTGKEEAEVLQVFADWGLNNETVSICWI